MDEFAVRFFTNLLQIYAEQEGIEISGITVYRREDGSEVQT